MKGKSKWGMNGGMLNDVNDVNEVHLVKYNEV
jgi:hypothetical protein